MRGIAIQLHRENHPTEFDESLDDPREDRHTGSHATDARYADFTTEGGLVVYDRDDETAWIESDTTVDRRGMM